MMTALPLLQVSDLSFRHPGRKKSTIARVQLTLYPGEIVLIAGATGSGKSTLLNCLAGISPRHTGGEMKGRIEFRGEDILSQTVRQRSQYFGILLQNVETQIFTDRVREELVFGLENWNIPTKNIQQIADASLLEFGLAEQRSWPIQSLSAGQKQRLLLASLLSLEQPVLMLDEPLAYLDGQGVEYLLQLLQQRARQGQSVLIVEHRLDVVAKICDRAYRVQDGTVQIWDLQSASSMFKAKPVPLLIANSRSESQESEKQSSVMLRTQQLSWGGYSPFPDLQVYERETLLLKGDNGCGKTTLLKLLCGLLKPATGKLEIAGRDRTKCRVIEIAKYVGFVLQNPNHQLFGDTVGSEVLQPNVTPKEAESLLESLNLGEFAKKHPQSLSQGQKRRLALAAVLVRKPKICLLDEIVVGQDPDSLALMLDALQQFIQQGGALVLTSHDPIAAEALQARVLELPSSQSR